jgi:anhydro-N-acetylmuramic acid kinase
VAKTRHFIGLYAGAATGVDAALVEVRGRRERMTARQAAGVSLALDDDLRDRVEALPADPHRGREARRELDGRVSGAFSAAVEALLAEAAVPPEQVTAVGSSSLRMAGEVLGSPAALAQGVGVPVAARFAESDVAAGGNGSAVTAWPAWRMLRHRRLSRVVVHLGAVASVVFVGSAAAACEVAAYDLGPGTAATDELARRFLDRPFDADGALAARGTVNAALLHELLGHRYFNAPPPKATAAEAWGGTYVDRLELMGRRHGCKASDLVTTATELSARLVSRAVGALPEGPHEVILAGGGAMNIHLAGRIRALLSPSSTYTAERYGLSLNTARAVWYAMLAAARVDGFAAHCAAAGGAARQTVLGSVTLP